jgi:hypothetical protein
VREMREKDGGDEPNPGNDVNRHGNMIMKPPYETSIC